MSALEKTYTTLNEHSSKLAETLISILKIIVSYRKTPPLAAIKSDTCYILGNGPSLKTTIEKHINTLIQKDLVCVNLFAQSEYFEILKPTDYVLIDGLFFAFENKATDRQDIKKVFENFLTVTWEMNIYIPASAKKGYLVNEILKKNTCIKINYFNYIVVSGYDKFKFYMYKKGFGMPQCQNVLAASLFLSINRGYKEIYLFGADHSWHQQISVASDNKILLLDQHFYNTEGKALTINAQNKQTTADVFYSLYKAFKSYVILNSYAIYRNCTVYNASEVSFIDAFQQKKI